MKKRFTIFILVFLTVNSFSQVNTYFQNNPEWKVKNESHNGSDCGGYGDESNYFISGDTLINSLTYKKILKKGITFLIGISCMEYNHTPYINSTPSFFLRSFGKKMYLIEPGDTIQHLLYDFNLLVGNTIPVTYGIMGSPTITVTGIDSLYTPYAYRKDFTLSTGDHLYEGIGGSGGLDNTLSVLGISQFSFLECYSLNDTSYYPSTGSSCDMNVGISDLTIKNMSSSFPNPFSDKTTIELNKEVKNASISIFNVTGAMVRNIIFSGKEISIERKELNAGVYYYQLENNKDKPFTGKLIIID